MREIQNVAVAIIQNNEEFNHLIKDDQIVKVCEYLIINKVSLLELVSRKNCKWINNLFGSDYFQSKIVEEENVLKSWELDFRLIKQKWESNGIDYMFHKSVGTFPYLSDNLDVMVRTKDFEKAGEVLKEMNYVSLRNIQEAHKEFYRKFIGDYIVGPIHLHERVCWGVPFEDVNHIWSNMRQSEKNPLVFYPDYEDGILVNTAHGFLEDHIIKMKDLLYIKKCIDSTVINWEYIIETSQKLHWEISLHAAFVLLDHLYQSLFNKELLPKEITENSERYISETPWVNKTIQNLKNKEVIMPFKTPHLWTRRHTALRTINDPSFGSKLARYYQVFGGLADRLVHLKLKFHNQPGIIIAFTGLDGAGKSQHINSLEKAFNVSEIKTKQVWTRVGSLPLTKLFTRIYKGKRKNTEMQKSVNEPRSRTKNKIVVSFWRLLNIIDLIFYYGIYVRFQKMRLKVVLCDRYYVDTVVDLEAYNKENRIDRVIYKIYKLLIPKPNINFFIDTFPSIIKERSNGSIIEDIDFNYSLIKPLAEEENLITIENNVSFEEASEKLIHYSLTHFFNKYPSKYKNYKIISSRYK